MLALAAPSLGGSETASLFEVRDWNATATWRRRAGQIQARGHPETK